MFTKIQKSRIERARRVQQYGDFVAKLLPWAWLATITFRWNANRDVALDRIWRYLNDLEVAAGRAIGWVLVGDYGTVRGHFHVHVLIAGVGHLNRGLWWRRAFRRFGRATIERYDPERGGASYVAAHALTDTGEIHFGGALFPKWKATAQHNVGRVIVAKSADVPSSQFHQTLRRRRQR
jgi:hypothetical protein